MLNENQENWIKKAAEMNPDGNKDFNEGWKNGIYAVLCYLSQFDKKNI